MSICPFAHLLDGTRHLIYVDAPVLDITFIPPGGSLPACEAIRRAVHDNATPGQLDGFGLYLWESSTRLRIDFANLSQYFAVIGLLVLIVDLTPAQRAFFID